MEFTQWPKTPRLFNSDVTVTEKIDGVNAGVVIERHTRDEFEIGTTNFVTNNLDLIDSGSAPVSWNSSGLSSVSAIVHPEDEPYIEYWIGAQSRKRMITPTSDNLGFAGWVHDNARSLVRELGPGRHFGEWWGGGVRRGYGLNERRLSLFNTRKWSAEEFTTPGLGTVPVLYEGLFDQAEIEEAAYYLNSGGSVAAPGFDRPEGVCVYHHRADTVFKYTFDGDGHKG